MARDKARDGKYFSCSQPHERDYVSRLYGPNKAIVKESLAEKCLSGDIHYSTHREVYELIQDKLGYPIPVSV